MTNKPSERASGIFYARCAFERIVIGPGPMFFTQEAVYDVVRKQF